MGQGKPRYCGPWKDASQRSPSFLSPLKNVQKLTPAYTLVQVCRFILRLSSSESNCVTEQYGVKIDTPAAPTSAGSWNLLSLFTGWFKVFI